MSQEVFLRVALHGAPWSGKTSLAKALAGQTPNHAEPTTCGFGTYCYKFDDTCRVVLFDYETPMINSPVLKAALLVYDVTAPRSLQFLQQEWQHRLQHLSIQFTVVGTKASSTAVTQPGVITLMDEAVAWCQQRGLSHIVADSFTSEGISNIQSALLAVARTIPRLAPRPRSIDATSQQPETPAPRTSKLAAFFDALLSAFMQRFATRRPQTEVWDHAAYYELAEIA